MTSTPRTTRYRSHREAIKGSFLWPLRLDRKLIYVVIGAAVGMVLAKILVGETGSIHRTVLFHLMFWLAAWPIGGTVLYMVNALAGGIMSREERSSR